MSFYTREGTDGVRAVELVTLARGQGSTARVWRYATGDSDVTLNGLTYKASAVTRGPIQRSQESGRTTLQLTLATATPFVAEWLDRDPLDARGATSITILRAHLDDAGAVETSGGQSTGARFLGTIVGLEVDSETTSVACEAVGTLLEQSIPRVPITRTCAWPVFGFRCGLNPDDWSYEAEVDAVGTVSDAGIGAALTGAPTVTLTMTGAAPLLLGVDLDVHYFDAGQLLWVDGARTVRMHIASADLSAWPEVTAVLYEALPAGAVGDAVTLWPGCQKTVDICRDRFANVVHFGGFPRLPERNPLREGLY